MKSLFRTIGILMWMISGILLFIFWLGAMMNWLGFLGFVLGLILSPGLVIFPVVFWMVEGVFPVMYFALWGTGVLGLILMSSTEGV